MAAAASEPNLGAIQERLFSVAKKWFAWAVALRSAAALIGLLAILPECAPKVPFVIAVFAMAAEACSIRSDLIKSRADRLLRILELRDGLGWAPDMTAIADILVTTPEKIETTASTLSANEFASQENPGPKRVFENLKESAWWTQQLALVMCKGTTALVLLLIAASVFFLVVSTVAVMSAPSRVAVARSVTALLVLVFSAGFVKLAFAYYILHERARTAVMRVKTMRDEDELARRLVTLYEYQNARSSGPLIPDSVYKRFQPRLNRLWAIQAKP